MVIFLYNLYIFIWDTMFLGVYLFTVFYPELCYKEVSVYSIQTGDNLNISYSQSEIVSMNCSLIFIIEK